MSLLLVTGFRPFLGETVNPSQEMLASLEQDARVSTLLLPVSYERSVAELRREFARLSPAGLLMFGQARGRAKISLERAALNWIECPHPDEDGAKPATGEILAGGAPALFSNLPLEDWKVELERAGVPADVSLSAGGYVCNHLLYHAAREWGSRIPVLFVHVPLLPQQAKAEPSMPLETMLKAAKVLVEKVPGTFSR